MQTLLGFADEKINSVVDWSCNKIGGHPNWMNVGVLLPKCCFCTKPMWHLVQIYCPLADSKYHRTLNMFICANHKCLEQSVTVLRSQKIDVVANVKSTRVEAIEDDWGTNDWIINTNATEMSQNGSNEISNVTERIENLHVTTDNNPCFNALHIYVIHESDCSTPSAESPHETQLYEDYINREGELNSKSSTNESYQKANVKHGDRSFYKFMKRISGAPSQCLRYQRNGSPLQLSSVSQLSCAFDSIPACTNCNSPRVFELQIMPRLLSCLKCDVSTNSSPQNVNIDFGCLYVYTCAASCWTEGDDVREEFVVVQPDPDDQVLKDVSTGN